MKSNFSKQYPQFASIEKHIRRAHAERSVAVGTWFAEMSVGGVKAVQGLLSRPAPTPARRQRLVVRTTAPR